MIFEKFYGGEHGFRREVESKSACRGWSMATLKSIKKLNAESNSDLLAEAEFIFNNADEVLASFAAEETLAA